MEGSKILFCCSKFPWVRERFPSKFIDNLCKRLQKVCQPWSKGQKGPFKGLLVSGQKHLESIIYSILFYSDPLVQQLRYFLAKIYFYPIS